ncbi:MAG: hypothetical protein ACF787_13240 [Rhodopirellula sp. JB053]|uniref:hypothetical protein n=1 Tax=Rhodopirellula sp. JB044 TaxID=3342844 RepID=UPI003709ECF1
MTPSEKQFINAWRYAGPELENRKQQKLRELDPNAGLRGLGAGNYRPLPMHGMAIMQSWFMRFRVKQMMANHQPPEMTDDQR